MGATNKKLKVLLRCAVLAIVIIGTLFFVNIRNYRVNQMFSSVEMLMTGEDNFEILRTVNVSIDGSLRRGLFNETPRFRGLIQISGHPYTFANEIDVFLSQDYAFGFLQYVYAEITAFASIPRIRTLGVLHTNHRFSSFVIQLFESEPHDDGGYISMSGNRVIVAPATDIYSAKEILRSHGVFWSNEFGVVRYQTLP